MLWYKVDVRPPSIDQACLNENGAHYPDCSDFWAPEQQKASIKVRRLFLEDSPQANVSRH